MTKSSEVVLSDSLLARGTSQYCLWWETFHASLHRTTLEYAFRDATQAVGGVACDYQGPRT